MNTLRSLSYHAATALRPTWMKAALLALCAASMACTTTPPHREAVASRESAAPSTFSESVYRDPGVINAANNTGNPPQDLDPHTVQWHGVRSPDGYR